jgi:xanthine/uracil permease
VKGASAWLLIIGFFTAIVGGIIGLLIGANIASARETAASGEKTYKYDDYSRRRGLQIAVIGAVVFLFVLWKSLSAGS